MRTITKAVLFGATLCGAAFVAPDAKAEAQTHDGFYLQLNAGLGYLSSSAEFPAPLSGEITYSGVTIPSSLLIGGTVGPVVIGGGFFGDYAPSPSVEMGGESADLEDVTLTLIGIGMFADIYPNPKEGLHFQPFVGFGALEASYQGNAGGSDPTGLILALGVGYDFWVGNEWSIGPMFRFDYAPLALDDVNYNTIAPSLLCTFTYH
ncbi:MAG TPA: hypothetical protein VM686_06990 [Polyangiaceae bacterium]|nr:hypothetical protein [Polyangiaceae bacterium]